MAGIKLRAVRPDGWRFDIALLAGFAVLTIALAAGALLDLDTSVRDWCDGHRPDPLYWAGRAINFLGNGGPLTAITLVVAIVLAIRRRSLRPVLPVVSAFLLTGWALFPLKLLLHRAAPHAPLAHAVELFSDPSGRSYPSGHMVNTVVWYGVLALLLAPWLSTRLRRLLRVLPPFLVFASTVYLGFHWITDSVAGLLLGIVLDRLLARVPWDDIPLPGLLHAWARPAVFTSVP